jgi:hypothetical protein
MFEKERVPSPRVFVTPVDSDSPFWHTIAMNESSTWFRYN